MDVTLLKRREENAEHADEDRGSRIEDRGSRIEDRGSRIEDRGSRIEDRGSRIEDRGSRIEDRIITRMAIFNLRSSILDPLPRVLRSIFHTAFDRKRRARSK